MWWNTPFQSTLPQGEWLLAIIFCFNSFAFQSTLPQGEWRQLSENSECYFLFQSTLPQGEWQDQIYIKYNLPWFQSTLPQGEWLRKSTVFPGLSYFNPHSRKGSDNFFLCGISCHWSISIHTPARGVTQQRQLHFCAFVYFNPHSRKGSDELTCQFRVMQSVFQSTLPQGEWQKRIKKAVCSLAISIHTPARGVTPWASHPQTPLGISIHTPTRGVTVGNWWGWLTM